MQVKSTLIRIAIIKKTKEQVLVRMWRHWNPCALLVGLQNDVNAIGNSMEFPQKIKNLS